MPKKFKFTKVLLEVEADNLEDALVEFRKVAKITPKALSKKISKGEIEVKRVRR